MVSTGRSSCQALRFFAKYSAHAVRVLEGMKNAWLVLLTGGLHTSAVIRGALTRRHAHLLGLGRAIVACLDLPILLAHETDDRHDGCSLHATREPNLAMARPLAVILSWIPLPKLVGAGAGITWYTVQMRRVAAGMPVDYALGGTGAVPRMWFGNLLPVEGILGTFAAVVIAVLALAVVHAGESAQT
jgi:hypothetical protein